MDDGLAKFVTFVLGVLMTLCVCLLFSQCSGTYTQGVIDGQSGVVHVDLTGPDGRYSIEPGPRP